jgi:hypothetical protein
LSWSALDEVGEVGVEVRVALRGVAVAREDHALGVELALQRVADRVERREVGAGHDELREGCRREILERDLRFPRPPLDRERAGSLL